MWQVTLPTNFAIGSGTTAVSSVASGLGYQAMGGSFTVASAGSPVVLTITRGNDGAVTNAGSKHGLEITNIQNSPNTGTSFVFQVENNP